MVREPLDDTALDQARAGRLPGRRSPRQLVDTGVKITAGLVDGPMDEARDHANRVDLEREQLELFDGTGLPIVTLPALPQGAELGSIVSSPTSWPPRGWSRDSAAKLAPALDVDDLINDAGTGSSCAAGRAGSARPTAAAALGAVGGRAGRRTCVLTIDPARRLAQALGLDLLANTPRERVRAKGLPPGPGQPGRDDAGHARTFDES